MLFVLRRPKSLWLSRLFFLVKKLPNCGSGIIVGSSYVIDS